jgi:hypothetical protein
MTDSAADPGPWYERLRGRRDGEEPEVLSDRTVRLQGDYEWRFEGSHAEVTALAQALPGVVEVLSSSLALLSFGNAVGFFDVPGLGRIEVISGKWDVDHFEQMLRELTDVAVNLPFSSGDAAALPYDRSVAVHEDVLYHAFVYLRHVLLGSAGREDRVLPALQLVLRDPHRRFLRTERVVPVGAARQLSGRALERMVAGRGGLHRVGAGAAAALPLARALQGHLPERVEEASVVSTVDTPENRFAKAFLALCTGTIAGMERAVGQARNAFERRILDECHRMSTLLRPAVQHSLWSEVGPMVHFPASSTVLQRRRGYRELLKHWVRLRLATRIPISAERARDLLEVKDIAELYELWCFFSLVAALERRLGPPVAADRFRATDFQTWVPWDLEVRWKDGVRALYNPRFSRSKGGLRHSYSVPLRPDIALETRQGPNVGLHLLDAKFKLEKLPALLADAEDESAEQRGAFKRDDIYKMHTYHDAIVDARSVWILYPGTEFAFFSSRSEPPSRDPGQLPCCLNGVGSIPHRPDHSNFALDAVLGALL